MTHRHLFGRWPALMLVSVVALACSDAALEDLGSLQQAATIQVPGDQPTIQAAIQAAAEGDVISVAPGAYSEDLSIVGKAVKIVGDAQQRPRLTGSVWFSNASGAELRNFEVYSSGSYSGILVSGSAVTLDAVYVSGFSVGIRLTGAADSVLSRCAAMTNGNGVIVEGGAGATVASSLLLFNSYRGLQVKQGSNAVASNNTVVGNGGYLAGYSGILCEGGCTLRNNILVNNEIGLTCAAACDADYNLIWGNAANYGLNTAASAHDQSFDPQFVDPAEYDFQLKESSSAIDAGTADWAANYDYQGVPRPQGAAHDLGAYEYVSFTSTVTLAITEVMANPANETTGEFVELHNYGTQAVDAAGLVVWDGDATDEIAGWQGGSTLIPAGGYAVVLDPDFAGEYTLPAGALRLTVASGSNLGNGLSVSDPVSLWEANRVTRIDRFSFPFDPGNGVSVEKVSIEEGDVVGNWKSSTCGASPGAANCVSQPSNVSRTILIAINEVMANPLDESTGEFVELYNFGTEAVDLAGMILSDGDSDDLVAGWQGGTTVLQPGEYGVILDPDYTGAYSIPASAVLLTIASSTTLGNGLAVSDPISLIEASGQSVIDTFSRPFDPGNGVSVEKVDARVGDVPSNWTSSPCAAGASPGAANCAAGTSPAIGGNTIAITEVMANPIDEDKGEYVELFNYGSDPVDVADWRLDDGDQVDTLSGFDGGTTVIPAGAYAVVVDREYDGSYGFGAEVVVLTTQDTTVGSGLATTDPIRLRAASGAATVDSFSSPFNPGNGISVEKIDLVVGDVAQNWVASPCNNSAGRQNCASGGTSTPEVASTFLVISEVMANPLDEGTGEYVELFNAGPVAVDVAGYQLTDGDAIDVLEGFGGGTTVIPAGGYAVILDRDYAGEYGIAAPAVRLTVGDAALGNGLSTTDPISLYLPDGATLVSTMSFPTNPGNGVSLERRVLTSGDVDSNWAASSCRTGTGAANDFASPGWRNCSDPGSGVTGDNVVGEACPYGALDCLSGVCLLDAFTFETYCSQSCASAGCPTGYACSTVVDIWNTGFTEVCVRN